jgi:hypothetical protein
MKFAALVPAICFLFTLGLFPVLAGDGPLDRATLVGMKSVGVLIEELDSDAPDGLT